MAVHIPDFVRVTIDGSDRTAYVVSYGRHSTLCTFSDTFVLEVSFEIPAIPDPYDSIVIRELYDGENEKILGGYIIDVTQNFENGNYIINGQDKTLLLDDYFIHTQTLSNNETVAYWINYYAGLVGLGVQYDTSVTQFIVEEGTPMGMITASDGLSLLERLAAVYIKYDAEIDKLVVFRINTSEPVIQITNNETTKFDREEGTDKTRNVVKVYGAHRYNIFSGTTTQVTAKAVTSIDELIVDKTVVVANPYVRRVSTAQLIATRVLQIVDGIDDVLHIETAGFYPQVDVGNYIGLDVGTSFLAYSADREVTSIQTTVDPNGVVTIFTVGEKCPRVSIMPPTTAVYATARNGGVLVSWNAGDGFEPFNKGIVSQVSEIASGIDGIGIAANKYGQLMAIVDNYLYTRTGKYGRWTNVSAYLSGPSDDEGEHQFGVADLQLMKVEKDSSAWGRFNLLAKVTSSGGIVPSGQERWWAYWTGDFGASWDSMQLYVPGNLGIASGLSTGLLGGAGITHLEMQTATSGALVFNVDAKDMEGGQGGNVTVLVQGEPKFWIPEDTTIQGETFWMGYVSVSETPGFQGDSYVIAGFWTMDGYDLGNVMGENDFATAQVYHNTNAFNITQPIAMDNAVFGVPNNRAVAYFSTCDTIVPGFHIGRTIGNYVDNFFEPYFETDIPEWEHLDEAYVLAGSFADGEAMHQFHDYSSLKGNSTRVRFAIVYGHNKIGGFSGDSYPTECGIEVVTSFFDDDIALGGDVSTTVTQDSRVIAIPEGSYPGSPLTYAGDGLFGYEAMPTTASPVPRSKFWWKSTVLAGGGTAGSMTKSKTGTNYAYSVYYTQDFGQWHGDDRDENWYLEQPPDSGEFPYRHPRDWAEKLSMGVFVVKTNLTTLEFESVEGINLNLAQYFNNPPAGYEDDDAIDDFRNNSGTEYVKMFSPNVIWIRKLWTGHGGWWDFYFSYPGFTLIEIDKNPKRYYDANWMLPKGVMKVPYYNESMTAEVHNIRVILYDSDPDIQYYYGSGKPTSYAVRQSVGGFNVVPFPPESPSGQVIVARQHPDYGIVVNEQRAMKRGRSSTYDDEITRFDYDFMHKANRADPYSYTVIGSYNGNHVLDPYDPATWIGDPPKPPVGRTNEGQARPKYISWDFRSIEGSTSMADGGSSGIWNFLE